MSSGVTVVTSVTMILFTVWFGNFILRTVDVLYKPSVKKWIRTSAFEDDIIQQSPIIKSGDNFFLHYWVSLLVSDKTLGCILGAKQRTV